MIVTDRQANFLRAALDRPLVISAPWRETADALVSMGLGEIIRGAYPGAIKFQINAAGREVVS